MNRGFWFVAGAGAGVWAVARARRAAEALTPEGLADRAAGVRLGAQLFAAEFRDGMQSKESELRERLGFELDGPRALSTPSNPSSDTTPEIEQKDHP